MGLVGPFSVIRAVSLFHLTAAYFFLTTPRMIAEQNIVFILGEAMRLPHVTALDKPNEATAFIAVVLAFLGIADLTAASLPEIPALEYWTSNTPMRLVFLFVLTAYTYLFKEDGMFGGGRASIGEPLQNGLVFAFGFMETAVWFWVFLLLRDERRAVAVRMAEERAAKDDRMMG